LVCEHYQVIKNISPLRRGGVAPALSDEEVITREICGEYFKVSTDKDLFSYFRRPYAPFFPRLTDRTRFVRQAANLWQVTAASQQRLTQVSGHAAEPVQSIDTLPLPVWGYTRSGRDRCFKPFADYGPWAAKKLDSYGFKLGLRIPRCGLIPWCPLLPARPHDIQLLDDLVAGFAGLGPADRGFLDTFRHTLLADRHGVCVVTAPRKRLTTPQSPPWLKVCARLRKGSETVGSHRTARFAVARLRVHELWHFQHRLIRQGLAHTVGVVLNLQLRRPALDLDGLVTV
jgi:hypothetical protein